ncbi:hypothetical protein ACLMJK_005309 [Lecanora helva]
MSDISQILAQLAAQRPGGTPTQAQPPQQQHPPPHSYPPLYPPGGPPPSGPPQAQYPPVPQPSNTGSIDLSNIKPVNSGSVSLADAVAKARGIAAEKGVSYGTPTRDMDPRRMYRRSRSRSRSPPRMHQSFHDNYNPYRDERRDDARRTNAISYGRERTFSPDTRGPPPVSRFSPPRMGFDSGTSMGRNGGDEGVETIPIESNLVGLIIGRQGENLRRVEAETRSRVQFVTGPENSGPMRQCKITGTRQARDNAKNEIFRIIEENPNAGGNQGSGRAPPPPDRALGGPGVKTVGAHQPALRVGEDATQIMVPNRTVGLIIGRGGETIRDLQERSGCHVNIVGEEKSINGLRPVNLIGTPQTAGMAKDLIMEIVESDTKSLANSGNGAGALRERQPAVSLGVGDGEKINDQIFVPSEAVGMIIGKGGETIKNMQIDTGCKINVSPATGQDYEREIGLIGSRDSIQRAKNAIMEKVHAVQEKNNRSAGAQRRGDDQQYSNTSFSDVNTQPYGQPQRGQPSNGAADPYAAYGGYENYIALWYNSYQQNAQQNPQTQGPPGS